ncbi:MAG: 50S ribosomal protein L18 [Candidatus Micrarchaeaceae archaeon]|jgi:large subunit ribosomal protein L18
MHRMIRRRKRTSTTNYKKRVAALKSDMNRVVIRKSNRAVTMQVIGYEKDGDKIVASANSKELKEKGWEPRCNIPTAYLTGMLLASKLKDKKLDYILDIGLYRPVKGSVIFAAAKGFQDNGANLHSNIEFDEARISGSHIQDYATKLDANKYKEQFSSYIKNGFDAKAIKQKFDSVKKEIMSK